MGGTEAWQLISPLLSGIADTKEGCEAYVMVYRALKEMDETSSKCLLISEIDKKMAEILAQKTEAYGAPCIEAYCDSFSELKLWVEQLKAGGKNE